MMTKLRSARAELKEITDKLDSLNNELEVKQKEKPRNKKGTSV
jgi:hypothetical protein